ncbi:MAG TPA: DUF1015 domain-containing protein [Armatimonadota bacterium]|nr:DUF1015 domain-containing protein [Armatimonadota bacterium]
MADIRPFGGVRYNQAKIGDLSAVVAPPYDVISPQDQEWYYNTHPNNVVRLILPKEDAENGSKYEIAAACLDDWLKAGILIWDDEPCLYACEQEYEIRGQRKKRLGFTCLVRLEDFERRTVLPHENVLARPLEDRLKLIRATQANFDSVFGLHADGRTAEILKPFLSGLPDASAVDKDGVRCDVRRISDPAAVEAVAQALAGGAIVIADGHHRYSAALAYRDEMRAQAGTTNPNAPYEFVMMTLVSLEDEGLVVLPTHRLVRNLPNFDAASFLSQVRELFDVEETPRGRLEQAVESLASEDYVFGLYLGGDRSYLLKLKPTVRPEQAIGSPGSDALKRLDVSVLHSLVLERLLGVGAQNLSAQSNLSYTRGPNEAMSSVDRGGYQMCVLMNPPRVEEVKAVAAAGDRMPQKSTFFYPKLLTGMVMRVMREA